MNSNLPNERYARQLSLKQFGAAAQQKLLQAKVLVVGAGGLGCPALQYLAAAGVGTIGVADDDSISLSNLHRQILFTTDDIGFGKADTAAGRLRSLNPEIITFSINERLTVNNTWELFEGYDIIIDGTDNFSSRYMINDACVLMKKPLIYGAVSQWEGQITVFSGKLNYRDLFPDPPKESEVPSCAEAGVLGVLPGMIGVMMAAEAIKLITGVGEPLVNRLLLYNLLNNHFYEMELQASAGSLASMPVDREAFEMMDYAAVCGATTSAFEIDPVLFDRLLIEKPVEVIDVREPGELPFITEFQSKNVPVDQLSKHVSSTTADTIVLVCATGTRSAKAAGELIITSGTSKNIYSLRGGIQEWMHAHSKHLQ